MEHSSPEYIKTSLAAAMVLGFEPGRFYRDAKCYCVNLLLTYPSGCVGSCAYCGLSKARIGEYNDKSFIRVKWPVLKTEDVISGIIKHQKEIRRLCVSMITHKNAYEDTKIIAGQLAEKTDIPISCLIAPTVMDENKIAELKRTGVDIIGIGLDAASPKIFERTRGRIVKGPHLWEKYWRMIETARNIFGLNKVSCHIVVGIGESDRDLIELFFKLKQLKVLPHLFCFYPELDSKMAKRKRPSLKRYRQIQLIKYLVESEKIKADDICLNEKGMIIGLNLSDDLVAETISKGTPFITSGCPGKNGEIGCNRPFAHSRPGEPFRNFPFNPEESDIKKIKREMRSKTPKST